MNIYIQTLQTLNNYYMVRNFKNSQGYGYGYGWYGYGYGYGYGIYDFAPIRVHGYGCLNYAMRRGPLILDPGHVLINGGTNSLLPPVTNYV